MNGRRLGMLAAVVTMGGAGWYVFVYLYRWEWNRALISGVIFLAAELALIGALVMQRLTRIERKLDGEADRWSRQPRQAPDPVVLARLRDTAPPPREPFGWLNQRSQQLSVFVPVLLGAGVLLSGLAWIVERLARHLGGSSAERALARRLQAIALPAGGLFGHDEGPDPFSPAP